MQSDGRTAAWRTLLMMISMMLSSVRCRGSPRRCHARALECGPLVGVLSKLFDLRRARGKLILQLYRETDSTAALGGLEHRLRLRSRSCPPWPGWQATGGRNGGAGWLRSEGLLGFVAPSKRPTPSGHGHRHRRSRRGAERAPCGPSRLDPALAVKMASVHKVCVHSNPLCAAVRGDRWFAARPVCAVLHSAALDPLMGRLHTSLVGFVGPRPSFLVLR